jgi:hypothetical protein
LEELLSETAENDTETAESDIIPELIRFSRLEIVDFITETT